jgi:hypothetical protein
MWRSAFKNLQSLLSLLAGIGVICWLFAQLPHSVWSTVVLVIFVAAGFFLALVGRRSWYEDH